MSQLSTAQKRKETETEIAVLQVQYGYLNEKMDDIKTDLKDLRLHIDGHAAATQQLITDFQEENKEQHAKVEKKVSALEKWRWMLMGAGILAGAIGFPFIEKLLGM
jgi:chromosome segregation ATPase